VAWLLLVASAITFVYTSMSVIVATQLVYAPQMPITRTPAALGLSYQDVTFPSRDDHVMLRGWFIPGVLPDGQLTAQRVLIMVHEARTNRADPRAGLLDLSGALARNGFAVLAFDMRGSGQSPPAPLSLGYFEQRDVLGAVDFVRSGPLAYPALGRPQAVGGWGISMGAATLLLAAAREPAIQAVVSDSAFADIIPILEREVPGHSGLPSVFTPGALTAARALYGIDFYAVRPVDVVARLAPRPVLLIHGSADQYVPPDDQDQLALAARAVPNAQVDVWRVHGAGHAESYLVEPTQYVVRVVAFFNGGLGPDTDRAT
jgi:fermentation-respiration switch protein FrsA (DUF1100 family)